MTSNATMAVVLPKPPNEGVLYISTSDMIVITKNQVGTHPFYV